MLNLSLGADGEELLFDAVARSDPLDPVASDQFIVDQLDRREHTHAAGAEGLEQGAVFEFADHARAHTLALEPLIDRCSHSGVGRRQQHRHLGQRLRETAASGSGE
jgi:hypothetical protein